MILLALASQFQAYCRDLHDEAVDVHVDRAAQGQDSVLLANLTLNRFLDRGNANSGNLGSDFNRLGFVFIESVKAHGHHSPGRLEKLDRLNDLRNAIAHGNESQLAAKQAEHGIDSLTLTLYRDFRRALDNLADDFDRVVADQLSHLLNVQPPW